MGNCVARAEEREPTGDSIEEAIIMNNAKRVRRLLKELSRESFRACEIAKLRGLFKAIEIKSARMIKVLLAEGAHAASGTVAGDNCLHLAVKTGKIDLVELFLGIVNINKTNWKGNTPLYMAIDLGYVKIAELLLKHGANPNLMNLNGDSPLHRVVQRDKVRLAKLLLRHGANPNLRNLDGGTIFLRSICLDYKFSFMELLLKHGANVNLKCNEGYSVLHWAVTRGSAELCERVLQADVDVNVPTDTDRKTPLHLATFYRDDLAVVRSLVELGADVNAIDKDEKTALYYAASKNRLDMVQYLVSRGANVNCVAGCEPILIAATSGHLQIVEYLIGRGADIKLRNSNGDTLLCIVLRSVDSERSKSYSPQLQIKLAGGYKIDLQSTRGESPIRLTVSRYYEMLRIAKILINKGADVNFVDRQGNSLLTIAITNNQMRMVKLLCGISKGQCYLYFEKSNSMKELDEAIGSLYLESIKLLLDSGASVELDSLIAFTILSIVVYQKQNEMILDLLYKAVNINAMHENSVLLKHAKLCNNDEMCQVLIQHCALLAAKKLFVHKSNWEIIDLDSSFRKSYDLYRQELSKMKRTMICNDYDVTYFDVLHKRTSQVLVCVCSKVVRKIFELGEHKKIFQHYWEYLNYSYLNWLKRFELIYECSDVLFKFFRYVLSHDVIYTIIEYLSDRDLNNILLL